ncbi:MAG: class I SAM-dependent methyltransferase [Pedobacter sp.]|nr:MAG: class I SAM-dependent methyltransferase [Pedobacter sp.]
MNSNSNNKQKHWRWRIAQYFESRWWKNYLKSKDPLTYLNWKRNYWRDLLEKLSPAVNAMQAEHILDAGCGPAGIFMLFPEAQVTALDPLIETYEADLEHFKKAMYPQVRFVGLPLEELYIETQFDLIFCMNAINHVQDIKASIKVLYDHLKPKGQLVMSIDAHNFKLMKHIFQLQPADILHPHQYDLAEYKAMLTDLGMEVVQVHNQKREFLFNHYVLVANKS